MGEGHAAELRQLDTDGLVPEFIFYPVIMSTKNYYYFPKRGGMQ